MDWRRAARWAALTGLALSVLTACTVSVSGGVLGALGSIGLALFVFLLAGATQTGCDPEEVGPCLSFLADEGFDEGVDDGGADGGVDGGADGGADGTVQPDMYIGPCLSPPEPDLGVDMAIGPCLSPPEPDQGVEMDMDIGPCLDIAPDQGVDMSIGPCLSPPAPDFGVEDAAMEPDAAQEEDAGLQPCLSPPPPPPPPDREERQGSAVDKAAIFDKVAASLPADLAARLKKRS